MLADIAVAYAIAISASSEAPKLLLAFVLALYWLALRLPFPPSAVLVVGDAILAFIPSLPPRDMLPYRNGRRFLSATLRTLIFQKSDWEP